MNVWKNKLMNFIKSNIRFILFLIIVSGTIYIVTHNYYGFIAVQGDSMNNTLLNGQIGIIQKYNLDEVIEKGDIIVFYSDELEEAVIKRCVATGGDTVSMDHGWLRLDGTIVKEPYIKEPMYKNYRIRKITLAQNEYFAMGDNRNNSTDCRELGPTDNEHMIGKLVINLGDYGVTVKSVLITFAILIAILIIIGFVCDVILYKPEIGKAPKECEDFPIEMDVSICTGEKNIGFRNPKTKKLLYMELVRNNDDIIDYCMKYGRSFDKFVQK